MEHTLVVRPRGQRGAALLLAVMLTAATALVVMTTQPADAHGTGTVGLCERDGNSSSTGCTSAVFAACLVNPDLTCTSIENGPRDIEVQLSNFPANTTVHVWFLRGSEATDPTKSDCSKATDPGGATAGNRTHLGDVTTNSSGRAEFDETLPRSTWTAFVPVVNPAGQWTWGGNWVCATTANLGGTGTVGDRAFTIYPTPV